MHPPPSPQGRALRAGAATMATENLTAFLTRARLLQYEDVLREEGFDDVQFLRDHPEQLTAWLSCAPILMRPGHIVMLQDFLADNSNAAASSTGAAAPLALLPPAAEPAPSIPPPQVLLAPPAEPATRIHPPALPLRRVHDEELQGPDDEDEGTDGVDTVNIFWDHGFIYSVPLGEFATVYHLLEAVREQAVSDKHPLARSIGSDGASDWAGLRIPHSTGAIERQRQLKFADVINPGHPNGAYEALKNMHKRTSANVVFLNRESRRNAVPYPPHFRTTNDAKVAVCSAHIRGVPHVSEYDASDRSPRRLRDNRAELRFYQRANGPTVVEYVVDKAIQLAEWERIPPNEMSIEKGAMIRITVSGLAAATEYRFRVMAVGEAGAHNGSWATGLTAAITPAAQSMQSPGSRKRPIANTAQGPRRRTPSADVPGSPGMAAPEAFDRSKPPPGWRRINEASGGGRLRGYRPPDGGALVKSLTRVWRIYNGDGAEEGAGLEMEAEAEAEAEVEAVAEREADKGSTSASASGGAPTPTLKFVDKLQKIKDYFVIGAIAPKEIVAEANEQMGLEPTGALPAQVDAIMEAVGL